jgi:hypothetical protein
LKKERVVYLVFFCIIIFGVLRGTLQTLQKDKTATVRESSSSSVQLPPSSLDFLYPPKAQNPLYLIWMFDLGNRFTGILVDLIEEDFDNLAEDFEAFKSEYVRQSAAIPEWEEKYPIGPVEDLRKALKTEAKDRIMAANEKVGRICHSCHVESMIPVKAKYHWQDFRPIKVEDKIAQTKLDFVQLMRFLDFNLTGVTHNLKQGQNDRAVEHSRAFVARFQSLSETCEECHGTSERTYFIDDSIRQAIKSLNEVLTSSQPDQKEVTSHIMTIGMESCFKCHLVHLQAPYTKYHWKE